MKAFLVLILAVPAMVLLYFFGVANSEFTQGSFFSRNVSVEPFTAQILPSVKEDPLPELTTPDELRAIHLSYQIYYSDRFEGIIQEAKNANINGVILEIKDPFGRVDISGDGDNEKLAEAIEYMHSMGIYVVARMVVFEDPALIESNPDFGIQNKITKKPWQDYKGISWADPTSSDVWDYNIGIASDAVALGFDEINFDYIRFPTDGPLAQAVYSNLEEFGSREIAIASFLKHAREELGDTIISIDVFGMTFINDQMVIGQVLSELAPFVDVIAPMPYPSHYPRGFLGFEEPAEHPYEVIAYTLGMGQEKLLESDVIVRPWLQDFNLGAVYGDFEIQEQVRATEDTGSNTWFLWNSSNRYTFSAFLEEETQDIEE